MSSSSASSSWPLQLPLLKTCNGLAGKADGKDKVLATVQYVLMLISGGQPGTVKDVQMKVASARKVFRILKPLEALTPLLREPYLPGTKPWHLELLPKIKSICMATYFGGDHLVWLGSVNIIQNKKFLERCQKTSLWGWFLGSLITMALEIHALLDGTVCAVRLEGETDESWEVRCATFRKQLRQRTIVLAHATCQALLATGLLQLRPLKPRTTAVFGVLASALNVYMLTPAVAMAAPAKVSKNE